MKKILEKVERVVNEYDDEKFIETIYGSSSRGVRYISILMDRINTMLENGMSVNHPNELIVATMYHNVTSDIDYDNHELSAKIFIEELMRRIPDFKLEIDEVNKELVYKIISEHRKSYTGSYSCVESEVLATANKGFISLKSRVEELVKYAEEHNIEDELGYALHNIIDTFGRNGHHRYSRVYKRMYKDELNEMWRAIDRIKEMINFTDKKKIMIDDISFIGALVVFTINGRVFMGPQDLKIELELGDLVDRVNKSRIQKIEMIKEEYEDAVETNKLYEMLDSLKL